MNHLSMMKLVYHKKFFFQGGGPFFSQNKFSRSSRLAVFFFTSFRKKRNTLNSESLHSRFLNLKKILNSGKFSSFLNFEENFHAFRLDKKSKKS